MAKIKFGDYLKSKKQKEAVYESDESIVKRVKALIESDSCAVQPRFRVDNYSKALDLLAQIPDYPGVDELAGICRQGLEEAREAVILSDYQAAKYHLRTASTEHEFRKASDELAAACEELRSSLKENADQGEMLREAEDLKAQADAQIVRYSAKTTRRRWAALIVLVAAAAAVVYALTSGYAWYLAAKLEGLGRIYKSAYSRFYKLGDYLDSREQYEYYKEKYLRQREHEESQSLPEAEVGDLVEFSGFSWLVLRKEGTKLELICISPKEESAFSHVTFDGEPKVLREEMDIEPEPAQEQEDAAGSMEAGGKTDAATTGSVQEKADTAGAMEAGGKTDAATSGNVQEQEDTAGPMAADRVLRGSSSWKDSSLRAYLNETVLAHEFTDAETAAMVPMTSGQTSNPRYGDAARGGAFLLSADQPPGSSGEAAESEVVSLSGDQPPGSSGEAVEDKITILSVEQAQELLEEGVFKTPSVDMWMRTPGADMHSAVYMTSKGNVILYGNDVTDDSLSVCPLITVDYSKLEK